jgi:hypothetical protein
MGRTRPGSGLARVSVGAVWTFLYFRALPRGGEGKTFFSKKCIFFANQIPSFTSIVEEGKRRGMKIPSPKIHNTKEINQMSNTNTQTDPVSPPPKRGFWGRFLFRGMLIGGIGLVFFLAFLVAITLPNLRREVAPPDISGPGQWNGTGTPPPPRRPPPREHFRGRPLPPPPEPTPS